MPSLAEIRQSIYERGVSDEFATKANGIAGGFGNEVLLKTLPLSHYIQSSPKRMIAVIPPELLDWVYFLYSSSNVEKIAVDSAFKLLLRRGEFETVGDIRKASIGDVMAAGGRGMGPVKAGLLKLIFEPRKEVVE